MRKRSKFRICGQRHEGRICEKEPEHFGMHRGQGFVLSVTGAGFAYILVAMRTIRNTESATIRNAMIVLMKAP